jgi:sulfate transport system ATP-binding protein
VRIATRGLRKSFGPHEVLRGIDLDVRSGEFLALLGPSGCGKTTLLRILAGLEFADAGQVLFEDEDVTDRSVHERGLGFVFQHFALFRHLTVFENVAFGLRVKPRRERPSREAIRSRVDELLHLVRLEPHARHLPSELSGGQRQRVALARALAVEPQVLLLDEPFGSLDAQVRRELRAWLRRLHDQLGLTSVLVTHDQEEALETADRVAVMHAGEIVQVGSPEEVYTRPAGPLVYDFLGSVNVLHGRLESGALVLGEARVVVGGPMEAGADGVTMAATGDATVAGTRGGRVGEFPPDGPVGAYIRPHHVEIVPASDAAPGLRARVRRLHVAGPTVRLDLECAWGETAAAEMSHERWSVLRESLAADGSSGPGLDLHGAEVGLRIDPTRVFLAASESFLAKYPGGRTEPVGPAPDAPFRKMTKP